MNPKFLKIGDRVRFTPKGFAFGSYENDMVGTLISKGGGWYEILVTETGTENNERHIIRSERINHIFTS